jgi:hypothetical protein
MGGHPCAIVAIDAPDGNRWADHVLRDITRHTLRLRGDVPLLHVGYQAVGILAETGIDQLIDGLSLQRLAEHRQQMPRPFAPEHRVG